LKASKKSLIASGVSLLASAALLAGSTFAWFTDSVTNTGNKIQSGKLAINAYAYDLAADGTQSFTIEGVNGDKAFAFEATTEPEGRTERRSSTIRCLSRASRTRNCLRSKTREPSRRRSGSNFRSWTAA